MTETTMTTKFDQDPDAPYGQCLSCQMTLQQKSDADEHMHRTMQGKGPSHRVRVTNPPRERRIHSELSTIIDEALREVGSRIRDMVDQGHLTLDEARSVLVMHRIDEEYLEQD